MLTLAVFIAFGAALAVRFAQLRRGNAFYEWIEEGEIQASPPSVSLSTPAEPSAGPAGPEEPPPPEVHPLSLRLSRFAGEYPDAAAWLQLPGAGLDYPVMLGEDNQFYLDHLPDGSENVLGSLFLDYRTEEDSVHLIVYGHNVAGGNMFGLLRQYESQGYFLEHRTLTLATPDRVYDCPIFSVRRVAADSDAYRLEFEDGGLADYISQAAAESLYPTDVDTGGAPGVLTLSTCTGWRDQRFIVQAVLPPA